MKRRRKPKKHTESEIHNRTLQDADLSTALRRIAIVTPRKKDQ